MMRCLALDIGGTKIASAIVSGNQVTQRQQIQTPQEKVVEAMHQTLAQLIMLRLPPQASSIKEY